MVVKNKIITLFGICSLLVSSYSFAIGNLTSTTKATATLASSCSLSMNNIAFGNVIPGQASTVASNTLNITCSNGLAYKFNPTYPTDGSDCPNMVGAAKGGKLYYWLNYQGTVLVNLPAGQISKVGTGSVQSYTIDGKINQVTVGLNCQAPQNNPGANDMNPYVAPDSYSGNANMVITF